MKISITYLNSTYPVATHGRRDKLVNLNLMGHTQQVGGRVAHCIDLSDAVTDVLADRRARFDERMATPMSALQTA